MGEAKRRRSGAAAPPQCVAAASAPQQSPIVEPKHWKSLGNQVMTMVVGFGTATMRGGIPLDVVAKLPRLSRKDRRAAMNEIVTGLRTNRHLEQAEGDRLLIGAAAVALSSEAGAGLRDTPLGGVTLTYTITPLATPNDFNWRLVVEMGRARAAGRRA